MKRIVFHESYNTLNSTAPVCRELNWELGIFENLTSLVTCLPRHIHVGNRGRTAEVFLVVFSCLLGSVSLKLRGNPSLPVLHFVYTKDEMEPSAALKKCYYVLLKNFVRVWIVTATLKNF